MEDKTQATTTEKKSQQVLGRKKLFIAKSQGIHANLDGSPMYDYSKVEYTNSDAKVTIVCPKEDHGDFIQLAKNHSGGQGCPKCGIESKKKKLRMTKEEFEARATEVHHKKDGTPVFDYSLVNYIDRETKIWLICPDGHRFEQYPARLLEGTGCLVCAGNQKPTKKGFVERCQETRIDENGEPLYEYDEVKYVNSDTKIKIKCKNGHTFEQIPHKHLNAGKNCLECTSQCTVSTTDQFITESRRIYGNKYDYSATTFTKINDLVTIKCSEHGDFIRTAFTHLIYRRGCPHC